MTKAPTITFRNQRQAVEKLCIAAGALLGAMDTHGTDHPEGPQYMAVNRFLAYLEGEECPSFAAAHSATMLGMGGLSEVNEDTTPARALCMLLAMALEHPSLTRFKAVGAHQGRA